MNKYSDEDTPDKKKIWKYVIGIGTGCAIGLTVGFLATRIHVSKPHQYLVRTGPFLKDKDMVVSKYGLQWPFQKCTYVSMTPITYQFDSHSISKEKVEFKLPTVFTVCPADPLKNLPAFKEYVRLMSVLSPDEQRITIGGIVEGEMRGRTSQLTIEEMFSQKEVFRESIVKKIEEDVLKLGMIVTNANIKDMSDYDEKNLYFTHVKRRAVETANYEAQVAVAEAKKMGEIGVQLRDRDVRIQKANFEKEAKLSENDRNKEVAVSDADLLKVKAESDRISQISRIEADMASRQREMELKKLLSEKEKEQQMEALRAETLPKANAEAEAMQRLADAKLYAAQKEAEGIKAMYMARAEGLEKIVNAAGSQQTAQYFLGLESGLYPQLAEKAAKAVKGLNPKIHIWNTGSGDNDNIGQPFLKLFQSFAPAIDGLHDSFKEISKSDKN